MQATGSPADTVGKLYGLQHLRFIAAMMVVVWHMTVQFTHDPSYVRPTYLNSGVDVFMVISGFIMVYICRDEPQPAFRFWLKRLARITPLYWFSVALFMALGLAFPAYYHEVQVPWTNLLFDLFYLPRPDGSHPFLVVSWTLYIEIAFYTILSISMLFGRRFLLWTVVLLLAFFTIALHLNKVSEMMKFYASGGILLEFIVGIALALIVRRMEFDIRSGFAMIALGCLLMPLGYYGPRIYSLMPASAIMVGGFILSEPFWRSSALSEKALIFGDASYAIYLTHLCVIGPIFRLLGTDHWLLTCIVALSAATGLGVLVHLTVEATASKWFAGQWKKYPVTARG